ncbi:Peroxisomal biogenesis factor 11 [Phaffia rhodozyma]|uniref:Peroxisomal biogenesis factor 11 n=1 Tax=Phaffia rhodozyma TaxID=264483 RepID=A0A0F7SM65_PHARH|nr:Peroxisomal biogenesis factor 11 [Phaffia rhodozyma]
MDEHSIYSHHISQPTRPILATSSSFSVPLSSSGLVLALSSDSSNHNTPIKTRSPRTPKLDLSSRRSYPESPLDSRNRIIHPDMVDIMAEWGGIGKGKERVRSEIEEQSMRELHPTRENDRLVPQPIIVPQRGIKIAGFPIVFEDVLKTSVGREKVLKIVQYTIKLYLYLRFFRPRKRPTDLDVRLKALQDGLAISRRTFYFFGTLSPFLRLARSAPSNQFHFQDLMGVLSGASDEIYSFHRLGFVGIEWGERSNKWVNNLWLLMTLIGLSNYSISTPSLTRRIISLESSLSDPNLDEQMREEIERLQKERDMERWSTLKLWFDLVFVSYEVFGWKSLKNPLQILSGFGSALVAFKKIYVAHQSKFISG